MQEEQYYSEKWSFALKWIAVILVVILLLVIFIPNNIWKEEANMRQRSQWKMVQLWDAQRMYKKLTGHYDPDMKGVLWFVSAVRDSILADSQYTGQQWINYKDEKIKINVPRYWFPEYDTVFSKPYEDRDTSHVNVFTAVEMNYETGLWDTIFLDEFKDRYKYNDSLWVGAIIDTVVDTIIERVTKFKRFRLADSLLYCPLTGSPYLVSVEGAKADTVAIQSPTKDGYKERKFLFFSFKESGHGSINNGVMSWKR